MVDLSIIIVNWNTRDLLVQCLQSVIDTAAGIAYEIIVVDNHSADDSVEAVRDSFPDVRVISNDANVGFARANNQGIDISNGRYLLLLNSDTRVCPDALATMLRFMDDHPAIGIVGPRLLNADGSLQPSWAAFPTLYSEVMGKTIRTRAVFPTRHGTTADTVDWVGGACLLIQRVVIDQIGPMDPTFFMYAEEMDWCFRAKQHGWAVCYLPAAEVIHLGGQSSRQANVRMKAELYRSKLRFFRKHYGMASMLAFGVVLQSVFWSRALLAWLRCHASGTPSDSSRRAYDEALELARALRPLLRQTATPA